MERTRERGLDLLLTVDRSARTSLRAQVEDQLREAIRGGRLPPLTALPSTRALAGELGVSRGVVVEAYTQLAAEGFIASRRGGVAQVLDVPSGIPAVPRGVPDVAAADGPVPAATASNLLPMAGDLTAFPRQAWIRALRRALDGLAAPELSYADARGPARARETVAMYLARSRGVVASPDTTAFVAGVSQGVGLVASTLADGGVRRIAVEDPGFLPHRMAIEDAGLQTVPVPVDEDGIRVPDLERLEVGAVLITPAHQSPLGCALSAARRTALVRWAARRGAVVIEDDYDGEYRYDGVAAGALQGLAPEQVVYLGSVSKTLAPALRIGWIVAPQELLNGVVSRRLVRDGGTTAIEPLALASMIERGEYDRHLRGQRRRYATPRRAVLAALSRELPDAEPIGVAAGLHVAVVLADAVDPATLMQRAAEHALLVLAVPIGAGSSDPRTVVVVGFGQLTDSDVDRAINALAVTVRTLTG